MSEEKKGNTVLLTVIAVATLLVAVVGATFAYFTASVAGNDTASSVIINTAKIGTITYENGTDLKLENAYPGATSDPITFTIASDAKANVDVKYSIAWKNVTNGFTGDLYYTLTGANETDAADKTGLVANVTEQAVPATTTSQVIGVGTIKPNQTHRYTMSVHFKETGSDQNANQGKSFTGKIEVSTGDDDETYYNDANKEGTTTKPVTE